MTAHHRYDVEPLARWLRREPLTALHRLGVNGPDAEQYAADGLTWKVADRLAVAIGLHPALVWPEWVDHGIAAVRSRKADSVRRSYWRDPDRKRKAVRAHHHANRDRQNAARRARYQANADRERSNRRARHAARKESAA